VEIARDIAPDVPWALGPKADPIPTLDEMARQTKCMIEEAFKPKGKKGIVRIYGIWSSGEWLFHKDGWAYHLGKMILSREDVELKVIITKPSEVMGDRAARIEAVRQMLNRKQKASIEPRWLNWWDMNRILTWVVDKEGKSHAIYMRRRLCRPLVCPYFIDHNARDAIKFISELWEVYWSRAEKAG
jgi:hypothetical protein